LGLEKDKLNIVRLKNIFLHIRRTIIPDAKSKTVLSNGNSNAFIASIPIGGQLAPNSTVGDSAL